MKAIIITKAGDPSVLQIEERPKPVPGDNQVLIRIAAAGVNRPDVAQRKGHYPPPAQAPQDVPGLEVSGYIEQCGSGVSRWKPGDEVCALVIGGGYAEYVLAHADHCLPIPSNVTLKDAAGLPEAIFTVWHNVFQRGRLANGERFLVHGGSSGIGIFSIQIATAKGAQVYTTAGTDDKCEACIQLGAADCINYKKADFEAVLASKKIDVILDMVGGEYIAKNLRLLNNDGRLIFINAMKGNKGEIDVMDIMRRRLTISGSTLRNRGDDFKAALAAEVEKHVWPLFAAGSVRPVVHKIFKLEDAAKAHELMESSSHIGKIILSNQ